MSFVEQWINASKQFHESLYITRSSVAKNASPSMYVQAYMSVPMDSIPEYQEYTAVNDCLTTKTTAIVSKIRQLKESLGGCHFIDMPSNGNVVSCKIRHDEKPDRNRLYDTLVIEFDIVDDLQPWAMKAVRINLCRYPFLDDFDFAYLRYEKEIQEPYLEYCKRTLASLNKEIGIKQSEALSLEKCILIIENSL